MVLSSFFLLKIRVFWRSNWDKVGSLHLCEMVFMQKLGVKEAVLASIKSHQYLRRLMNNNQYKAV